jgi:hypothetical protein
VRGLHSHLSPFQPAMLGFLPPSFSNRIVAQLLLIVVPKHPHHLPSISRALSGIAHWILAHSIPHSRGVRPITTNARMLISSGASACGAQCILSSQQLQIHPTSELSGRGWPSLACPSFLLGLPVPARIATPTVALHPLLSIYPGHL